MKRGTRSRHRILGALLLSLALYVLVDQQLVHGQQEQPQAANALAYQPPIGIPAPSFGIVEIAPAPPSAWPGAAAPGYYYIDNSHPNATDTNNPNGYPNRPRQSIPEIAYPAGSYVEIHGGDYPDPYIWMDFTCTLAQPCWVRGTPGNMPKISGQLASRNQATYVIFEYLNFEGGSGTSVVAEAGHHLALRHSLIRNKTWDGNNAGVGFGPRAGTTVHDVVVYKNTFHNLGDWQATTDQDFHGVGPGLWGLDETSGSELYNYWILENTCYQLSGDCVQVNAGWGQGAANFLHHIYIGKNVSYRNRQAGFASKQARDVIISQNVVYGSREGSGGPGDGILTIYDPDNVWILYNELYDNDFGIRLANESANPNHMIYIIGNVIRDNATNLTPCGHWSSPYGWGISLWYGGTMYVVNNTIYNTRGGIEVIEGGNNAPTVITNNIIADLNGMDYVDQSPACGDFTVEPGKVEHLSTNFATNVTVNRNLFAQTNGQPIKINGFQSLAAYQTASGQCANCRTGNPLFVGAAQANFTLQPGSPALDAGSAEVVYQRFFDRYGLDIRVDYRNQPRPQGANWDIGAYEGNAPATTPTPSPTPTSTVAPIATATATRTPTPVQSASCGNGFIEGIEACDDGNTANGDGCTNQCVIEQSCYDPGNTFSFFTWSDSYGSAGDGGAMRLFADAVNRTRYPTRVLPRFWFANGDVPFVPGIEPLSIEDINSEISGANYPFTCAASNRTFPLFVALGNHDVDGNATQIATKLAYWSNQIGPQVDKTLVGIQNFRWGPNNGYDARTTYSFDYKNTHFVVYNQYYGDPTYPTDTPLGCVRQTMYEWIEQDLTNTTRPIKIVVGHEPAWSYCSNAPGYNSCMNYGNSFTEDLLNPNERPRPHSTSGTAWLEAYGRHWGDSLEDAQCPAINGQEGRVAFWQMLARHKVVTHLVGHTHTYSSRLVDADGPRNDAPMTQAERNRMAYGKNGDVFSNSAGVWEVDSGMAHNSAGSVYVLVTVRDNRVTFEAWDQMGANENEEPFRLVETWHVDVEGAAPAPVLAATAASTVRINLSWTDVSNDESGFKIERSPDGVNGWTQIATVGANVTTFANTGLSCGDSYSYRVRAYNNSGDGPFSNVATAATRLCTPVLQAITNLAQTQLTLNWTDGSNTESGFKIERSPDGVNGWTEIATANANATSYTDSGLLCETAYFYRVRGYTGNTNSPYSNVVTASTTACLVDLIFADGFESGNLLAWSARAIGGGDLRVSPAAALVGGQGMEAVVNDNLPMYVTDDRPTGERSYHARYYFDPNAISMANGNAHYLFYGYQGTAQAVLRIEFRRSTNRYQLRAALLNDGATWQTSNYVTIKDRSYVIEVDWQAATAPGANNGRLDLWINEVEVANLTGIDNDTRRIDRARLGPLAGLDTGTRGNYFFDAFESRRLTYIGTVNRELVSAEGDDLIVVTPALTNVPVAPLVQNGENWEATAEAAGLGLHFSFPTVAGNEALTATVALTDTQTTPDGYILVGEMMKIGVNTPGTLVINYSALSATLEPTATLALQRWNADANQWEALTAQVNAETQTITVAVEAMVDTTLILGLWQEETLVAVEEISEPPQGSRYFLYLPLAQE